MQITQVQVEIHEKRNHPFEYGNFDAAVRLTADLHPNDDITGAIVDLRKVAGSHVASELDLMEKRIRDAHDLEMKLYDVRNAVRDIEWSTNVDGCEQKAFEMIEELPSHLWWEWKETVTKIADTRRDELAQREKKAAIVDDDDDQIPF